MNLRNVRLPTIPDVIKLPYGKAPPMHVQAGSWKQLLRLLAKASGTRVEPATEAFALTSGVHKLRVVVQFVKVRRAVFSDVTYRANGASAQNHLASSEWRTVLYLTIDHPAPPKLPSAPKPNDPNALPFSYTLSSLPTLLRDGADSNLSKYYNVPETASMPLPNLPITLPDLALYLAAALEGSRRVKDAANAARRLSRFVDEFYPAEAPVGMEEDDADERRPRWKRFMKRSKPPTQSVNANMYELVTPFPFSTSLPPAPALAGTPRR
jgi:hypothetical protein